MFIQHKLNKKTLRSPAVLSMWIWTLYNNCWWPMDIYYITWFVFLPCSFPLSLLFPNDSNRVPKAVSKVPYCSFTKWMRTKYFWISEPNSDKMCSSTHFKHGSWVYLIWTLKWLQMRKLQQHKRKFTWSMSTQGLLKYNKDTWMKQWMPHDAWMVGGQVSQLMVLMVPFSNIIVVPKSLKSVNSP
jgi:hypothetical protein